MESLRGTGAFASAHRAASSSTGRQEVLAHILGGHKSLGGGSSKPEGGMSGPDGGQVQHASRVAGPAA